MPTDVLVKRLLAICNPFPVLGLTADDDPMDYDPVVQHRSYHRRTRRYHLGRIHYFAESMLLGEEIDPIEVNNECWGTRILPDPILLDGHHRFCAAAIIGRRTLRVNYGGRTDVLDWLRGARTRRPREW